jgi:hypothetical protein
MKRKEIIKKLINEGFSVKTLSNFNDKQISLLTDILSSGKKNTINEASFEQLEVQFVKTGRLPKNIYNEIVSVSNNKSAYATWLISTYLKNLIPKNKTIKDFKDYFEVFDKYKKKFTNKDLGGIKSETDVNLFVTEAEEIIENLNNVIGSTSSKDLVSLNGIEELKSVGIKYLGLTNNNFQCFEVPSSLRGNEKAHKIYKKYLAECKDRSEENIVNICTMATLEHFNTYLEKGPLFVFFNLSDEKSPYQFSYEGNEYMNKDNKSIIV